jgi:hypothetical protein
MIEHIMKIPLSKSQYSSLCYLANHNDKEDNYVTNVNEAFSRFKYFMTRAEMIQSIQNKVNYVMFTKQD